MIINETESRKDQVIRVAKAMMAAARTAPKAKGKDMLEILTIHGDEDLGRLAREMRLYSEESGLKFFLRDALNVEQSDAVVIIGTRIGVLGLNCGYCGFETCEQKSSHPSIPCAFNTSDMGLAAGSAAVVASHNYIDNRIFFSAGKAAIRMGILPGCGAALAIVLSCTSKNPFFDRIAHKS